MICPSSVLAHLTKFIVTIVCIKTLSIYHEKASTLSFHVFQMQLLHSIIGLFRFGAPFIMSTINILKYLRIFYDWYSKIVDIVPLALFTAGFLHGYGISQKVWITILFLGILPIFFYLQPKQKESQLRKHRLLMNIIYTLQLLMITLIGLRNSNYSVMSLVISYLFERFFIDEFCYRYDIPSTDLAQYSLCFIEIFMVLTLNEL